MESRILNFPDAMKLASIFRKYVDYNNVPKDQIVVDFISSFLENISPRDYKDILFLLLGESSSKLEKASGEELLQLLVSGLEKNRIISLLEAFEKIGFK